MVGNLTKVSVREVFKSEARDFTVWMEENIHILNEQLGFNLSCLGREKPVGDFNVDLVAEDGDGHLVVIENQLEKSNHDHLGKIITYLANLEAKSALWIVSEPRPEHVKAVVWLNETYAASFFLIKLEGLRIDDSQPAPLFTLLVGPSEESRDVGKIKEEEAERHTLRREFWQNLQSKLKGKTFLHANLTPGKSSYLSTSAGKAGVKLVYRITAQDWGVELYIGTGDASENKRIFEKLSLSKQLIERSFGNALIWMEQPDKQASCIRYGERDGGLRSIEKWPVIQERMTDSMICLHKALKPYLETL